MFYAKQRKRFFHIIQIFSLQILQTKAYKRMFHLVKNKKSIEIPHRLPTEHAPSPSFQCQINSESCKKYRTIVLEKVRQQNVRTQRKDCCFDSFSPDCNSIQIETGCLAITVGSGRYFVKLTSSALMSKLQLQLFYRLSVCGIVLIYQNVVLIYCFGKQFFVRLFAKTL